MDEDKKTENIQEEVKQEGNSKLIIGAIIAVAVLAIGGFIFAKSVSNSSLSSTGTPTAQNTPEATGTLEASTELPSTGTGVNFIVEGGEYFYKPNQLKVKKGDKVKITFNNSGGMHDFVIDELNVKSKLIRSNESDTIEFTADKAGTFEFYCSVGQHRKLGMKGTLVVE